MTARDWKRFHGVLRDEPSTWELQYLERERFCAVPRSHPGGPREPQLSTYGSWPAPDHKRNWTSASSLLGIWLLTVTAKEAKSQFSSVLYR